MSLFAAKSDQFAIILGDEILKYLFCPLFFMTLLSCSGQDADKATASLEPVTTDFLKKYNGMDDLSQIVGLYTIDSIEGTDLFAKCSSDLKTVDRRGIEIPPTYLDIKYINGETNQIFGRLFDKSEDAEGASEMDWGRAFGDFIYASTTASIYGLPFSASWGEGDSGQDVCSLGVAFSFFEINGQTLTIEEQFFHLNIVAKTSKECMSVYDTQKHVESWDMILAGEVPCFKRTILTGKKN